MRDSANKPLATFSIIENKIMQLKGLKNGVVDETYWPFIKDFIIRKDFILANDKTKLVYKNLIEISNKFFTISKKQQNLDF
jgi:hypothetical protein